MQACIKNTACIYYKPTNRKKKQNFIILESAIKIFLRKVIVNVPYYKNKLFIAKAFLSFFFLA